MATAHEVSKGRLAHDLAQITFTWEASNTTQEEKWKVNPEKAGQLKSAASEQDMKRKAAEIHVLETFHKKMALL